MMPDLGKYATEVLTAYGATLVLLGLLVALTVWRGRRVRTQLEQAGREETQKNG